MNEQLLHWHEGGSRCFRPTTLTELGKSEEFLEEVIYDNFGLLGLEQGQIGIRGPFQCWRQVSLNTPEGRTIYPDIVAISASGHLIVVEVKLGSNDELKSRKVISQIIDYASSFASASRAELLSMFSRGGSSESTWEGFVGSLFPDLSQIGEMSALLEQRIGDGELNLVIACDKSPLGTRELLRGVAVQAALGFQLDLIEIIPHVDTDGGDGEIVFVPHRSATTEIISRTAVTVLIEEGAAEPGVVVESTSLEEIEESLAEGKKRRDPGRKWTPDEIEEVFEREGTEVKKKLLQFCKQNGLDGRFSSHGLKKNAAYGFVVPIIRNGLPHSLMAFTAVLHWDGLWYYMRFSDDGGLGELLNDVYVEKLSNAFEGEVDFSFKEPTVPWSLVERNYDEFCEVLQWLKHTLEDRVANSLE
jgi:hypothetical protein